MFGSSDVPPLTEKAEHHVTLSWTASASDSKHAEAVGYCIYRKLQGKNQPLQRLNRQPFTAASPHLRCVDDLVENGKKYVYMVRAISDKRYLSDASNVAHAEIPRHKSKDNSSNSVPLCRGTAN